MASRQIIIVLGLSLFSLLVTAQSLVISDDEIFDIHDLLPKYGLPKGLIPNNVKSYSLENGVFTIELHSHCYVHFDELVYYEKKITGKISYGSVHDVVGIQAKKLFLWVPVTGIEADPNSGMVEFFVGFVSEKLPAKQFDEIPVCKTKAADYLADSM